MRTSNPYPIFAYMYVESCERHLTRKRRMMSRAKRIQSEQYTIFRSRLHRKSLPECRSCHEPIHANEVVCPWCGAHRKEPVTGSTQPLPKLPSPTPWYRAYDQLLPAVLLVLFQARLWLWLWPMPEHAVGYRTAVPEFTLFYYAMVCALLAALFYHCRWIVWLSAMLICLVICWMVQAVLG